LRERAGMTVDGGAASRRRRLRTKVRPPNGWPQPVQLTAGAPAPAVPRSGTMGAACGTTPGGSSSSSAVAGGLFIKERHPDYVLVKCALDPETLGTTEKFLRRKRPQPAKMKNEGGDSDDERKARYDDRDSRVSWFNAKSECPSLHRRLVEVVQSVGNKEWPLLNVDSAGRLDCVFEQTQYAVYGPNQHFKAWHQDAYAEGHDMEDARQITIVAMISEKRNFTGGEFQVKVLAPSGKKVIRSVPLDAGDAVVFPAKRLVHRVQAVKTGIRKTLVFWANDPMSCKYYAEKGF